MRVIMPGGEFILSRRVIGEATGLDNGEPNPGRHEKGLGLQLIEKIFASLVRGRFWVGGPHRGAVDDPELRQSQTSGLPGGKSRNLIFDAFPGDADHVGFSGAWTQAHRDGQIGGTGHDSFESVGLRNISNENALGFVAFGTIQAQACCGHIPHQRTNGDVGFCLEVSVNKSSSPARCARDDSNS